MIKNIIFDIGQVLAEFKWKEVIQGFGLSEDIADRLGKVTVEGPYWLELDRGAKSKKEIISLCTALDPEISNEIELFYAHSTELVREFDYSAGLIMLLKNAGYKVYLLSNYGDENFCYARDHFKFIGLADGAVISYQVKSVKPEPKIYETLLTTYNLCAEESIFLDDVPCNLSGAENFGIHTILFRGFDEALKELKKYNVKLADSILFDLDGTLWDSTYTAAKIWENVARRNPAIQESVTPGQLKQLYGLPLEEIAVQLFKSIPAEIAIETMNICVVEQCPYLAEHGGNLLGAVEEVLKELKKNYKLFIVSNCKDGYIQAFLEAHQLTEYFDDFECPGRTGVLKADNIRLIMERNRLEHSIYVGDTQGDCEAAHQAGIPFIYARYGFGNAETYEVAIDSIQEIKRLL